MYDGKFLSLGSPTLGVRDFIIGLFFSSGREASILLNHNFPRAPLDAAQYSTMFDAKVLVKTKMAAITVIMLTTVSKPVKP